MIIRETLAIGDEILLFLIRPMVRTPNTFVFRRIQGAYRYAPIHIREGHENWVFESVNEHNNMVLTEKVLEEIRRGDFEVG